MITNSLAKYGYSMLPILISKLREKPQEVSNLNSFLESAHKEVQRRKLDLEQRSQNLSPSLQQHKPNSLIRSCLECEQRWVECAQSSLDYLERYRQTRNAFFLGFSIQDFQMSERHFDQLLRLRKSGYGLPQNHNRKHTA